MIENLVDTNLQVRTTRDRSMRVEFFYEELMTVEYADKAEVSLSDLLGTLGGNLGLFLGFQGLNLFEVLELIGVIFAFSVTYNQGGKAIGANKVNPNNTDTTIEMEAPQQNQNEYTKSTKRNK